MYCYAENVPFVDSDVFDQKEVSTLYVPSASIEMYKSAYPWNGFGSILPLTDEMLAIDNVIQDTHATNSYSINGTKQSALSKGINIIRMSDGTTRKVYVR